MFIIKGVWNVFNKNVDIKDLRYMFLKVRICRVWNDFFICIKIIVSFYLVKNVVGILFIG